MGVPPAKLHEKPAEANKSGTEGEQKAGFFDPVIFAKRELSYFYCSRNTAILPLGPTAQPAPLDTKPIAL
jgi:hypothetical protein